jgi:predicted ATPase
MATPPPSACRIAPLARPMSPWAEALLISEETGERWAIAEVLRIKAGLFVVIGRPTEEVEALLVSSLQIARHQQARSWELRTTCDLARLWQHEGRGAESLRLIQTIYDQFTEGFDTADLRTPRRYRQSWS